MQAIFDELQSRGVSTGLFNLPEWKNTAAGFDADLERMFGVTPPTALVIEEPVQFYASLHFCARRGLQIPRDISLVCGEYAPGFA